MRNGAVVCCTVILLVLIGLCANADELQHHRSIVINSDYEFTAENGVCSGQGTANDPYVIEDWRIDAGLDDYGIRIHGTTRWFVIRNVDISGAAKAGVYLSYVRNGTIEDCTFEANWAGVTLTFSVYNRVARCAFAKNTDAIRFYFSAGNQILDCTFDENDDAVWFDASNANEVVGNLIVDSHMGIYLNLGSEDNYIVGNAFVGNFHNARADELNRWDDGSQGNFWSDYSGVDADEDGIWDLPYWITSEGDQDRYPLVTHPLVPAPPPPTCG
jgi:nitrous oxidase accessory protein